ncbi:MAG: hypothetical protein RSJ41_10790, partial [Clostridia bacterium]
MCARLSRGAFLKMCACLSLGAFLKMCASLSRGFPKMCAVRGSVGGDEGDAVFEVLVLLGYFEGVGCA